MSEKECPKCGFMNPEDCTECEACGEKFTDESEFIEEVKEESETYQEVLPQNDDVSVQNEESDNESENAQENIYVEKIEDDEVNESEQIAQTEGDIPEVIEEVKKSSKALKIICIALAAVLVIAGAVFAFNKFEVAKSIKAWTFDIDDVSGKYSDKVNGMYYDFKKESKTVDVKVEAEDSEENLKAQSDASISSDGSENANAKKTETKKEKFDGTFESGYTKDYIDSVIIRVYVEQNNLAEEYEKYMDKNGLIADDYKGFAKKKKIKDADLKKLDESMGIAKQGDSLKETGYWKYDKKDKFISIYNSEGNFISKLKVDKQGLVDSKMFLKGPKVSGEKFDAVFVMKDEEYKATETISMYKDGNCIFKLSYDDQKDTEPQVVNGTYKAKDGFVSINLSGSDTVCRAVSDGLALFIYEK